ncbi:FG-GAP-like repeat-containing protein [Rurimicrobium arvi]|uniref:VCBS repeat-containing protein n=1 Tax=Rurimicrobium arvi TaxID=2049916 RepID=A0ABP8MTV2_9BACT
MKRKFMTFLAFAAGSYALHAQKPVVTSVNPMTGITGSTVVISGSGFNTTASLNKVWFGATAATPVSATSTSLTVNVPAGANYSHIAVLNQGSGLQGEHAFGYFLPSFTGNAGSVDFQLPASFTALSSAKTLTASDLDGDGKTDLVCINGTTISLFRNTAASGSLTASSLSGKSDIAMSSSLSGIAIADIDGDGKKDLLVINNTLNKLSVFRNIGTPGSLTAASFAAKVDFNTDGYPAGITIADFDGDGKPDVAIRNASTFSVFRNTASGGAISSSSFAARVDYAIGSLPETAIASCDLDGDNKAEIIVPNYRLNTVSVFRNTASAGSISTSSFASAVDFATGDGPNTAITGDIDGDGRPELIVANQVSQSISVLRNTATAGAITTGSFAAKTDFALGSAPYRLAISDVDGDGKGDIVSTHYTANSLCVLMNNAGSGSISASSLSVRSNYITASEAYGLYAGDLDGDGRGDLAVTNYSSGTLSLLRANDVPFISGITPLTGKVGNTITITGTGFNANPANNKVWFGATAATPVSVTNTSLTVNVPAGATYSQVGVLNSATALSTQYTTANFMPAFTGVPGLIALTQKTKFTTGNNPTNALVIDLDGDGKQDVVTSNVDGKTISIFRNTHTSGNIAAGSLAAKVDLGLFLAPLIVTAGDLDGDGKPELIVADGLGSKVSVFRNNCTPGSITAASFATKLDLTVSFPTDVTIGDLDADGKPEIIATKAYDMGISVFRNTMVKGTFDSRSFAAPVSFVTGAFPLLVAAADLDGDKKTDVVVVNRDQKTVSVFRNIANGAFTSSSLAAKVDFVTGDQKMAGMAIGDLNADGKPEMAFHGEKDSLIIFPNTAVAGSLTASSFGTKVRLYSPLPYTGVKIADMDGDGKTDLVISTISSVSVFRTTTTGTITPASFAARLTLPLDISPGFLSVVDMDGDKRPDIVAPGVKSTTLMIISWDVATATGRMIEGDATDALASADGFTLEQNVPNPFTANTSISYTLSGNAAVTLELYDVTGKRTASLVNAQQEQGKYTVNIDGANLTSGVYLFVLKVADKVYYKRAVKL